jgi:hypothetical protein
MLILGMSKTTRWVVVMAALSLVSPAAIPLVAQGQDSPLNEVVLPIVVNGAVAEKEYYQTIFTVLNTSLQDVQATLQIYSNAGLPAGAFCSPIAPPPASSAFTLRSNQQYFQFTSADLPFLDGWARLTWEGSPTILVSQELTLAAAVPSPCKLVCNLPSTQKLSSAQITAVKLAREFKLPVTINQYRQTAVALINPSSTDAATVDVSILDQSGKNAQLGVPGHFVVTLRPLERISKFLWQMALEQSPLTILVSPPDSFQGSVIFSAASPFVVSALNIMYPEGKFVPVPALSTSP